MTDNQTLEQLLLAAPRHRIQRILEQCYKHFDELPTELRAQVAEVMNAKERAAETRVNELDLSTRARNVLDCLNCKTVADILALGGRKIMTRWSCGEKTVAEIRDALNKMEFALPK